MTRKPLLAALAAAFVLTGAGAASAASSPGELSGVWRTAEGDGLVSFRPCGDALCGYIVDTAAADAPPRTLLIDRLMRMEAAWTGGRILDPRSRRAYAGEVRALGPDRIRVTGCLVGPLCGSQVWRRAR